MTSAPRTPHIDLQGAASRAGSSNVPGPPATEREPVATFRTRDGYVGTPRAPTVAFLPNREKKELIRRVGQSVGFRVPGPVVGRLLAVLGVALDVLTPQNSDSSAVEHARATLMTVPGFRQLSPAGKTEAVVREMAAAARHGRLDPNDPKVSAVLRERRRTRGRMVDEILSAENPSKDPETIRRETLEVLRGADDEDRRALHRMLERGGEVADLIVQALQAGMTIEELLRHLRRNGGAAGFGSYLKRLLDGGGEHGRSGPPTDGRPGATTGDRQRPPGRAGPGPGPNRKRPPTRGPLAGIGDRVAALDRVAELAAVGRLEEIGAGGSNRAYAMGDRWVLRVGRATHRELRAMIAAARLGLGPQLDLDASLYIPGPTGARADFAVLKVERVQGRPLGTIPPAEVPDSQRRSLAKQIVEDLARFHGHGWAHGDLHGRNVLITHDLSQARLIDYGNARHLTRKTEPLYRHEIKALWSLVRGLKPREVTSMADWFRTVSDRYMRTLPGPDSPVARTRRRIAGERWDSLWREKFGGGGAAPDRPRR